MGKKIPIAMLCKGMISPSVVDLSRYGCLPFGSLPSLCCCGGPLSVFRFAWRAGRYLTSCGRPVRGFQSCLVSELERRGDRRRRRRKRKEGGKEGREEGRKGGREEERKKERRKD